MKKTLFLLCALASVAFCSDESVVKGYVGDDYYEVQFPAKPETDSYSGWNHYIWEDEDSEIEFGFWDENEMYQQLDIYNIVWKNFNDCNECCVIKTVNDLLNEFLGNNETNQFKFEKQVEKNQVIIKFLCFDSDDELYSGGKVILTPETVYYFMLDDVNTETLSNFLDNFTLTSS